MSNLIYCKYEKINCAGYSKGLCRILESEDFESPEAQENCPFYKDIEVRNRELYEMAKRNGFKHFKKITQ